MDGAVTGHHLLGDRAGKYLHGFDEKLSTLFDEGESGLVDGTKLKNLAIWTVYWMLADSRHSQTTTSSRWEFYAKASSDDASIPAWRDKLPD